MKLYGYFRSSAAYRVRIALNLKGLAYDAVSVHLLKDGGQQFADDYLSMNPTALVPTLRDGTEAIGQSIAIIEYLEETHPSPALLPVDAVARARVRAIAQTIACDIHPLNNLRVLKYLKHDMKLSEQDKDTWYRHWISVGLSGIEAMLANSPATGRFCHGDQPTLADLCLVPQLYNARRFNCDESAFPTIVRIDAACAELDAFSLAAPEQQPDYVA
ncbi:maleylacetoacetate isomerase [Pollutimonas harenae]|uniref:Maleylacetoacetate isomerase n=1 Tax=Pollutimonas harenae TaxID=657015 RepID=A0A853GTW1_9BURK|nr:maleylacetoacetate isomerase [Pollutimonas harenae]NYT85597.1 maleylacetoacetate isomerase [Pollutimonas harenae]TEA70678.1 maleylacetoacetate isomerase [Pollutimonas harenae]